MGSNISRVVAKKTNYTQVPVVYAKLLPENMVLKGGYVAPTPTPRVVKPQPIYVAPPKPVVVKPQTHSTKNIVTIDGLMYQNQPFTKKYTWEKAKEYCQSLTLGNHRDWRLPNKKELNAIMIKNYSTSLKGYRQFIHKEFIENLPENNIFWSSITYEKDSSRAWTVSFNYAYDAWHYKANIGYTLCVR